MSLADLEKKVQGLSPEELQAFTQWFTRYAANLTDKATEDRAIRNGVTRMEDIIKGQTAGLTESQFRRALG
jgi:hypothetical protein